MNRGTYIKIRAMRNFTFQMKREIYDQLDIITSNVTMLFQEETDDYWGISQEMVIFIFLNMESEIYFSVKSSLPDYVKVQVNEVNAFPSGQHYSRDVTTFAVLPSSASYLRKQLSIGACSYEPVALVFNPLNTQFNALGIELKDQSNIQLHLKEGQPTVIKAILKERMTTMTQKVRIESTGSLDLYKDNHAGDFTNVLAEPLNFHHQDQWEVAATSFTFTPSFLSAENEYSMIFVQPENRASGVRTIVENVRIGELVHAPAIIIEGGGGHPIHLRRVNKHGKVDPEGKRLQFTLPKRFFHHESAGDSVNIMLGVDVAVALGFISEEEITPDRGNLKQFRVGPGNEPVSKNDFNLATLIPSSMVVYSDIVEPSIVGADYHNILTVLSIPKEVITGAIKSSSMTTIDFTHPQFNTLSQSFIPSIRISLRKINGDPVLFYDPEKRGVHIDLLFRRKEKQKHQMYF